MPKQAKTYENKMLVTNVTPGVQVIILDDLAKRSRADFWENDLHGLKKAEQASERITAIIMGK